MPGDPRMSSVDAKPPSSDPFWKRPWARALVALLGFGTVVGLVAWHGAAEVLHVLEVAGPRLLWVGAVFLPGLALVAFEWSRCFPPGTVPRLRTLVGGTWIMFGVNWLLPVARIGGDVARIRILAAQGHPTSSAAASVVVDKTLQVAGQALVTIAGVALFALEASDGKVIAAAAVVTLGLSVTTYLLVRVQRKGLFGLLHRIAGKLLPKGRNASFEEGAREFDDAVRDVWLGRGRLLVGLLAHLGFRLVQTAETWFLLDCFGHPLTLVQVFVLETLSQAIRAAAFLVPGALGVQEGAFLALGTTFGLPPEIALSTSLGKRLRELLIGLPGLFGWWLRESQLALRGAAVAASADEPDADSTVE